MKPRKLNTYKKNVDLLLKHPQTKDQVLPLIHQWLNLPSLAVKTNQYIYLWKMSWVNRTLYIALNYTSDIIGLLDKLHNYVYQIYLSLSYTTYKKSLFESTAET